MACSLFSYIDFFMRSNIILMALVFYQKKKTTPAILFFFYLVYTIVLGSRSGAVGLFVIFLIYPVFENFQRYKKQLKRTAFFFMALSPVLFVVASSFVRKYDVGVGLEAVVNQIAGRLSFLETSMLPIHYKDTNLSLDLFYDKYSIVHQIKLMIDALIPGNVFEQDVMPNQYYRAVFLGYSEEWVLDVYNSINLTLPVYLYMYFNSFFTVIIGIGILVGYYLLCHVCYKKAYLFLPLIFGLYHLLYFFDFVMWFLGVFPAMLTMLTIYGYSIFQKGMVDYFKRKPPKLISAESPSLG